MAGTFDIGTLSGKIELDDEMSRHLDAIEGKVKSTSKALDDVGFSLENMKWLALGAVAAVAATTAAIVKLGEHGSEVGDITESFDKLTKSIGVDAPEALAKLRAGVGGTVDDLTLMKSSMTLLQSGAKVTAEDMGTLASAARLLSERGVPIAEAFNLVSSAMTTGRTRALSMKGIVVDLKDDMQQLTLAGKANGEQVTETAALHVKQTEILKALNKFVVEGGQIQDDFADKIAKVKAQIFNWGNELAKTVAESPKVAAAMDRIGDAFMVAFGGESQDAMDAIVKLVEEASDIIADLAVVVIDVSKTVIGGVKDMLEFWDKLPGPIKEIAKLIGAGGLFVVAVEAGVAALVLFGNEALVMAGKIDAAVVSVHGMTTAFLSNPLGLAVISLGTGVMIAKGQFDDYRDSVLRARQATEDAALISEMFAKKTELTTEESKKLTAAMERQNALGIKNLDGTKKTIELGGELNLNLDAMAKAFDNVGKAAPKAAAGVHKLTEEEIKYNAERKKAADTLTGKDLAKQIKDLDEELRRAAAAGGVHQSQIQKTVDRIVELAKAEGVLTDREKEFVKVHGNLIEQGSLQKTQGFFSLYQHGAVEVIEATDQMNFKFLETQARLRELDAIKFDPAVNWNIPTDFHWEDFLFGDEKSTSAKIGDALKGIIDDSFSAIQRAVEGGGNPVLALATSLGSRFAKQFGEAITANLGSIAGGIATAGVGLFSAFATSVLAAEHAAHEATLRNRREVDELRKQLKDLGIDAGTEGTISPQFQQLQQDLGLGTGPQDALKLFQSIVNDTTAAMDRASLSVADLGTDTDKLSRSVDQVTKDFILLTAQGFTLEQQVHGNREVLSDLFATASETGTMLPETLEPYIRKLIETGEITDEAARKILGMAAPAPWEKMEAIAKEFNIDLGNLGVSFTQSKLTEQADTLAGKFELLVTNGANVDAVIKGMGGQAQEFLTTALRWGIEIPSSLRPLLEKMAEAGDLVDENGDKLEDLSDIKWAESPAKQTQLLLDKLDELIDALIHKLPDAVDKGLGGWAGAIGRWGPKLQFPDVKAPNFGAPDTGPEIDPANKAPVEVTFEVDGQTLASASVPYIPGEAYRYQSTRG